MNTIFYVTIKHTMLKRECKNDDIPLTHTNTFIHICTLTFNMCKTK